MAVHASGGLWGLLAVPFFMFVNLKVSFDAACLTVCQLWRTEDCLSAVEDRRQFVSCGGQKTVVDGDRSGQNCLSSPVLSFKYFLSKLLNFIKETVSRDFKPLFYLVKNKFAK